MITKKLLSISRATILFLVACVHAAEVYSLKYSISGIDEPLYENAISNLNKFDENNPAQNNINHIKEISRNNIDRIKKALEPYGYFNANIKYNIKNNGNNWLASYAVNPGSRLKFDIVNLNVSDNSIKDITNNIKAGDYFSIPKYQKSKEDLLALAHINGYLNADISSSSIKIDLKNKQSTVNLQLDLGPQYKFGKVIFNDSPVSTNFLNKLVPFKKDDLYLDNKIEELKNNLLGSKIFSRVNIIPHDTLANPDIIDIKVDNKLKPQKEHTIGVGFDSDEYFRFLYEVRDNLTTINGATSKLSLETSVDEIKTGISYTSPGNDPLHESIIHSIYLDTKDNEEIGTSKYLNASSSKKYKRSYGNEVISLNIHYEKSEPTDDKPYNNTIVYPKAAIAFNGETKQLLSYSIASYIFAGSKKLFSNINILKAELLSSAEYNISPLLKVAGKMQLGGIISNNFNSVPLSFQFISGGASSIRGYSYNSIGPGSIMEIFSTEIQHKIYENWSLFIFIDAGNISNNFTTNNFNIGIGPGVMFSTSIGDAKISFGNAIKSENKQWLLQFNFSPKI